LSISLWEADMGNCYSISIRIYAMDDLSKTNNT